MRARDVDISSLIKEYVKAAEDVGAESNGSRSVMT